MSNGVSALEKVGPDLFVGGGFLFAGDNKISQSIGRYCNNPPTITPLRQAVASGSQALNRQIARVADADQAANTLTVTINGGGSATVNGVTVAGLSINASGQVTAIITAAANATTASFTLRVTDNLGAFNEGTLVIDVVKFSVSISDSRGCTGPGNTVAVTLALGNTGAQVCANNLASFGGGAPLSLQVCSAASCPATGPGSLPQTVSPSSDLRAGSVLVYNIYTSATDSIRQNTRVNITNTHPSLPAFVHLFFVDGATCAVADSFLCLTPNQTASFLASDLDPGTTGYIVAVAVDRAGCPVNFNHLIGDEYVKFASGHAANLGAEAITAIAGGLPFCDTNSTLAVLPFDGASYAVLPHVLALDNIGGRADGNDTLLILNRLGGNLATGAATLTSIFGLLFDDAENALSFSFTPGTCQFRPTLSNNLPRTAPRFENLIPAGRSGWMKLWVAGGTVAMTGAAINFNANAVAGAGAFNQGHNLHALTTTNSMVYTIPIFPPSC